MALLLLFIGLELVLLVKRHTLLNFDNYIMLKIALYIQALLSIFIVFL